MAQLNEIIEQVNAIVSLATKLKMKTNKADAIELHKLSAELSTIALNYVLNTSFD